MPEGPADAVVVGWTRLVHLRSRGRAAAAVRAGARLVGTNEDPTFPTPDGPVPGAGPSWLRWPPPPGSRPRWQGSPTARPPTPSRARVPPGELRAMVGDRPSTDGALAGQLGVPFALVLSGVTAAGHIPADADPPPWPPTW